MRYLGNRVVRRALSVTVITLFALFGLHGSLAAQGAAYINSETILSSIPSYKSAEEQIERLRDSYQAELERDLERIEALFGRYQEEKQRLNSGEREGREREIIMAERKLKEREEELFGEEGLLATRSKELLDPIRESVQRVVDQLAKERKIALLFDVAMTQGIIFRDPAADFSQEVIKRLGY